MRERGSQLFSGPLRIGPVLIALVLIWVFFSLETPYFLTNRNLSILLLQGVVTAIIALGLFFVLIVGEIDLSIAANSGFSGCFMAVLLVNHGVPAIVAVAAAIAVGGAIGLCQGLWIANFGAPGFLVTFGGSLVLNGAQLAILPVTLNIPVGGTAIQSLAFSDLPPVISWGLVVLCTVGYALYRWQTFDAMLRSGLNPPRRRLAVGLPVLICAIALGIPTLVMSSYQGVPDAVGLFLVLLVASTYLMTQTRIGLWMYAVGGNRDASRRAGIPIHRAKVIAFAIAGALAAISGVVEVSRELGANAYIGSGTLLLEGVAACSIGGVSLFGGRGTVLGTVVGTLVIVSLSNGLELMGVNIELQIAITGLLVVLAVTVDAIVTRGGKLFAR